MSFYSERTHLNKSAELETVHQTPCHVQPVRLNEVKTNPLKPHIGGGGATEYNTYHQVNLLDPETRGLRMRKAVSSTAHAVVSSTSAAHDAIDAFICFTRGTRILTGQGERPIETLQIGDLVVTRDQGLRPIRWVGQRVVRGKGALAPVLFRSDDCNGSRPGLLVSPHHRMLFTGYRAELLYGESEVLIAARHLVDGATVVRQNYEEITYIHLMFDHHEVIYADGIATESFHAADPWLTGLDQAAREELFKIFPQLRTAGGHLLDSARTCLKDSEARLLVSSGDATEFSG